MEDLVHRGPFVEIASQLKKIQKDIRGGFSIPAWNNQRIREITSDAAPVPDCDSTDVFIITALAVNTVIGAPTGTPRQGQKLLFRIKDAGVAKTVGWNAIYKGIGLTLPATTVAGKELYIGFYYNSTDTKWECPNAFAQE
jgi:hypothetical protein